MGKMSGPALFMNSVIVLTALAAALCLGLYYAGVNTSGLILWTGIVAFMVLYHFGLRILMGNVTKLWSIHYGHFWFREWPGEQKLYRLLRVKNWKDKVLTYDPASFSLKDRSLEEIATTMAKSETDHWINEGISLVSILFCLAWGMEWLFVLTAVLAMIFDAQFILIQRYNRPRILRLMRKKQAMG